MGCGAGTRRQAAFWAPPRCCCLGCRSPRRQPRTPRAPQARTSISLSFVKAEPGCLGTASASCSRAGLRPSSARQRSWKAARRGPRWRGWGQGAEGCTQLGQQESCRLGCAGFCWVSRRDPVAASASVTQIQDRQRPYVRGLQRPAARVSTRCATASLRHAMEVLSTRPCQRAYRSSSGCTKVAACSSTSFPACAPHLLRPQKQAQQARERWRRGAAAQQRARIVQVCLLHHRLHQRHGGGGGQAAGQQLLQHRLAARHHQQRRHVGSQARPAQQLAHALRQLQAGGRARQQRLQPAPCALHHGQLGQRVRGGALHQQGGA